MKIVLLNGSILKPPSWIKTILSKGIRCHMNQVSCHINQISIIWKKMMLYTVCWCTSLEILLKIKANFGHLWLPFLTFSLRSCHWIIKSLLTWLTTTVKIDQSQGLPAAGILEWCIENNACRLHLPVSRPAPPRFSRNYSLCAFSTILEPGKRVILPFTKKKGAYCTSIWITVKLTGHHLLFDL